MLSDLFSKKPRDNKTAIKAAARKAVFSGALSRLTNFAFAVHQIHNIRGHIIEAGVGAGSSLVMLAKLRNALCPDRRIIAFDSFRGFPQDAINAGKSMPGHGNPTLDLVKGHVALAELDPEDITYIEGYFEDSIPSYSDGPIALLHIDVDLGKSYTEVLTGLWPHLVVGGIVIFDEYDEPKALEKWPDAKPAIDAFLADKNFEKIASPSLTRRMILKIA